jgi:hypothetical protein
MSSRLTSSAPMRSRSAASSAFSQPCSMWMRLHRPLQAVQAVLGQPGLQLAVGLDLFLQRLQRFHARRQVGLLARPAVLTSCCLRAAVFVELRHLLLQLVQAGVGFGLGASCAAASCCCRLARRCFVGRGQRVAVGARRSRRWFSWRDCSSMLRWSAASTWICCCTWRDAGALLVGAACAWRRLLRGRAAASALLFDLRGQQLACSSASWRSARPGFGLDFGFFLARGPLRGLFLQLHQALLDALAAFDHEADLASSRPTSALASYSWPWAWFTWSPAA